MRRREREGKTANGLRGEPARGLARDVGGMVVENDLDGGVGGVGGVEELEKLDEFATAVTFLDQGMDVTGEQIDTGHHGQGAVALVLVIAHHGRAGAGQWRANPAQSYRSPGCRVSRHKRRGRGCRRLDLRSSPL